MSFSRSLLLCLVAPLALAACAKERPSAPAGGAAVSAEAHIVPMPTLSDAVRYAKGAVVRCAPGATCSPSIGLLSFALTNSAAQCTASLVAPDILATNAHCVPDELQKAGASCRGRIWMNFAKSDNPNYETQIECDTVIVAKGAGEAEMPDYAFLKLRKASARPALRISRAGFQDAEYIRIEKVDPIKGESVMSGLQHEVTCQAAQHTLIADFNDALAPIPLLADCEVIKGNSGSALRGTDGTVRGVIYGELDTKPLGSLFAEKGMRLSGTIGPMGAGANFACLDIPAAVGAPTRPISCMAERGKNKTQVEIDKATRTQLDKFVNENQSQPAFRWFDFAVVRPTDSTLVLRPKCVLFPNAALNREESMGFLNFVMETTLDAYGRYESMVLSKTDSAPVKGSVFRAANGAYTVRLGGENLSIPACQRK